MGRVQVREKLDAPIQAAWVLVRGFGDISAWARGRVVRVEGAGVGMVRHVDSPAGRVVEQCEAHDDAEHTFSYRLVKSPWPFSNYVASVRLTGSGPDRCVIEWTATFETDSSSAENVRNDVESTFCDSFISKLCQNLSSR